MGRTKRWHEDMQARFAAGTFARVDALSSSGEDRTDFVREAVERELSRRWKTVAPAAVPVAGGGVLVPRFTDSDRITVLTSSASKSGVPDEVRVPQEAVAALGAQPPRRGEAPQCPPPGANPRRASGQPLREAANPCDDSATLPKPEGRRMEIAQLRDILTAPDAATKAPADPRARFETSSANARATFTLSALRAHVEGFPTTARAMGFRPPSAFLAKRGEVDIEYEVEGGFWRTSSTEDGEGWLHGIVGAMVASAAGCGGGMTAPGALAGLMDAWFEGTDAFTASVAAVPDHVVHAATGFARTLAEALGVKDHASFAERLGAEARLRGCDLSAPAEGCELPPIEVASADRTADLIAFLDRCHPSVTDADLSAAAIAALDTGRIASLSALMERGLDLSAVRNGRSTLLHEAFGMTRTNLPEIVRLLVLAGTDPHLRDDEGMDAFDLARRIHHDDVHDDERREILRSLGETPLPRATHAPMRVVPPKRGSV